MLKIVAPTGIFRKDHTTLAIRWNDGGLSEFPVRALRGACPCAVCVNEWTGEKMLDESKLPKDIRPLKLFSVGRYALGIHWSDGHKTGIYSYEYLRKIESTKP